jgi:hypothetical protein
VRFDNIFYADNAIKSYAVFADLKRQGVVPAHMKFQVDLVPAHSVIWLYVQEDLHPAVDKLFNDAVLREIDKIAAAIPRDQLAIQFDIASAVFARLERNQPSSYGSTKAEMQATFAGIVVRLANHVPADIDLFFHFCYGDAGHKHVVEPTDMGDMVEFANRLAARVTRPIQMIHMPVPRGRSDQAYFEPLKRVVAQAADAALPRPRALHRRGCRHAGRGSPRRRNMRRGFRSGPNADSAGAIRRRSMSCCASMPEVAREDCYRPTTALPRSLPGLTRQSIMRFPRIQSVRFCFATRPHGSPSHARR